MITTAPPHLPPKSLDRTPADDAELVLNYTELGGLALQGALETEM